MPPPLKFGLPHLMFWSCYGPGLIPHHSAVHARSCAVSKSYKNIITSTYTCIMYKYVYTHLYTQKSLIKSNTPDVHVAVYRYLHLPGVYRPPLNSQITFLFRNLPTTPRERQRLIQPPNNVHPFRPPRLDIRTYVIQI